MKRISRVHFIAGFSQERNPAENVLSILQGGANWIQLRIKGKELPEMKKWAKIAVDLCRKFKATVIINDYVEIAKEVDADGVHLGKYDTSPLVAREIMGQHKIIGYTINTHEDIRPEIIEVVDYAGVGPYKETSTKRTEISPHGIEGICALAVKIRQIRDLPVIAIGGITPGDIPVILKNGIYGIALSSFVIEGDCVAVRTSLVLKKVYEIAGEI